MADSALVACCSAARLLPVPGAICSVGKLPVGRPAAAWLLAGCAGSGSDVLLGTRVAALTGGSAEDWRGGSGSAGSPASSPTSSSSPSATMDSIAAAAPLSCMPGTAGAAFGCLAAAGSSSGGEAPADLPVSLLAAGAARRVLHAAGRSAGCVR